MSLRNREVSLNQKNTCRYISVLTFYDLCRNVALLKLSLRQLFFIAFCIRYYFQLFKRIINLYLGDNYLYFNIYIINIYREYIRQLYANSTFRITLRKHLSKLGMYYIRQRFNRKPLLSVHVHSSFQIPVELVVAR